MAKKKNADLGVVWHIPTRKRPVATTTKATSDLLVLLVETGQARTFNELARVVNYDDDAIELCRTMAACGYGDTPLKAFGTGGLNFV